MAVLSIVEIDSVTPRGGGGDIPVRVVVDGSGFGTIAGRVVFDPLGDHGGPFNATVVSWAPDKVEYDVPALVSDSSRDNRFYRVLIEKDGATDGGNFLFWVPIIGSPDPVNLPQGLDYQRPKFEEGPFQDVDDPQTMTAADFNRLADKVLQQTAGVGDMTKAVYDQNNDGLVDNSEAIDDAGTPRTWADIVALIGAGSALLPILDKFNPPSAGQTSFSLTQTPTVSLPRIFMVNGLGYLEVLDFTIAGSTVTWLNNEFAIETTDRVEILYFV